MTINLQIIWDCCCQKLLPKYERHSLQLGPVCNDILCLIPWCKCNWRRLTPPWCTCSTGSQTVYFVIVSGRRKGGCFKIHTSYHNSDLRSHNIHIKGQNPEKKSDIKIPNNTILSDVFGKNIWLEDHGHLCPKS